MRISDWSSDVCSSDLGDPICCSTLVQRCLIEPYLVANYTLINITQPEDQTLPFDTFIYPSTLLPFTDFAVEFAETTLPLTIQGRPQTHHHPPQRSSTSPIVISSR